MTFVVWFLFCRFSIDTR